MNGHGMGSSISNVVIVKIMSLFLKNSDIEIAILVTMKPPSRNPKEFLMLGKKEFNCLRLPITIGIILLNDLVIY